MGKTVKGIDKLIKKFQKLGKEAETYIDGAIENVTREIVVDARQRVATQSFDLGDLSGNITQTPLRPLTHQIYVGGTATKYAPYVEFGTGAKVDLKYLTDAGFPTSYALKFKGKGIKQVNLQPRPYLFPALMDGRETLLKELKKDLKKFIK